MSPLKKGLCWGEDRRSQAKPVPEATLHLAILDSRLGSYCAPYARVRAISGDNSTCDEKSNRGSRQIPGKKACRIANDFGNWTENDDEAILLGPEEHG